MRHLPIAIALLIAPMGSFAETPKELVADIVTGHILPRFDALSETSQALAQTAIKECEPTSERLKSAYNTAFDAWISASHLRFGPSEVDGRAFALAFWPDSRGVTPRALSTLLSEQDPIASTVKDYAQVSIAARGFYALEFLLYDEQLSTTDAASYHCQLVQTLSADIASTAQSIQEDWLNDYADKLQTPSPSGIYRSHEEALKEMFKSLSTGLQFTSESRLGRPLGTFDRPRPARAETRCSERSAQHVRLSLLALEDQAARLAAGNDEVLFKLNAAFSQAREQLSELDDPTFASVSEPQTRLRVEILQQSVEAIRTLVRDELGPAIGVTAGFNALDGD